MFSAFVRRHARATSIATVALAAMLPLTLATTSADAVTTSSATTQQVAVAKSTTAKATAAKALTPRQIARAMVTGKKYRWSEKQYKCLSALWNRESSWNVHAGRANGGPYGIPQAYPGKKMGTGWRHNATTQITWGLKYIHGRYNTPCGADKHQRSTGWY